MSAASLARSFVNRLLQPQSEPGLLSTVRWWEARRIPVNLALGAYAIPCFIIFFISIVTSGKLGPGEDAEEPMGLIAAPILFNICYTFGWVLEAYARLTQRRVSPRFGPILLALGLGFSLLVISLPAVFWGGYRLLQLIGVHS